MQRLRCSTKGSVTDWGGNLLPPLPEKRHTNFAIDARHQFAKRCVATRKWKRLKATRSTKGHPDTIKEFLQNFKTLSYFIKSPMTEEDLWSGRPRGKYITFLSYLSNLDEACWILWALSSQSGDIAILEGFLIASSISPLIQDCFRPYLQQFRCLIWSLARDVPSHSISRNFRRLLAQK